MRLVDRCVWVFGILRSREGEIGDGCSAPFYDGVVGGHGGLRYLVRVGQTCGLLQHGVSEGELMLPGAGGSHGDADPADAEADERADFEELQPDRAACRIGELGMRSPIRRSAESRT